MTKQPRRKNVAFSITPLSTLISHIITLVANHPPLLSRHGVIGHTDTGVDRLSLNLRFGVHTKQQAEEDISSKWSDIPTTGADA